MKLVHVNQAFCTVIAANYLAQALVLEKTLRRTNGSVDFFVLIVDVEKLPSGIFASATVCHLSDLVNDYPTLNDMTSYYDLYEFCTAVKPTFLKHILKLGYELVTFLDPDIEVFGPISPSLESSSKSHIYLTPHRLERIPKEGLSLNESNFLRYGTFNLGFICVAAEAMAFLDWWEDNLRWDCKRFGINSFFTDQKWIDLAPSFFSTNVIRNLGYNVAPWNLDERSLIKSEDGNYFVGSSKLIFIHYSQMSSQLAKGVPTEHWSSYMKGIMFNDERMANVRFLTNRYSEALRAACEDLRTRDITVIKWQKKSYHARYLSIFIHRKSGLYSSAASTFILRVCCKILSLLDPIVTKLERFDSFNFLLAGVGRDLIRFRRKIFRYSPLRINLKKSMKAGGRYR